MGGHSCVATVVPEFAPRMERDERIHGVRYTHPVHTFFGTVEPSHKWGVDADGVSAFGQGVNWASDRLGYPIMASSCDICPCVKTGWAPPWRHHGGHR